jgi:4a-hydroxytetrahydrobiopterin dehydratase
MSREEIKRAIEELDSGWELKGDKITKSLQFPSFMKAIEFMHVFMNEVAKIAERVNHHPVITIDWRTVRISLRSFDVQAVTDRDVNLAKEIQKILANSRSN